MKDPFAPYIHLFLLFESFSFLLIQGSARILAGGLTQRKEATFCQQRGYFLVIDGPAIQPIPQIAFPISHFFFFLFFRFSPFLFLTSSLRAEWNTRSHNSIESFFPLESPPFSHASLLPYPPFFRLALNKYRFRLSELTPVSALYPLLTRIEFRTEDRFLFCRDLFGGSRDNVFPFFLLLFFFLNFRRTMQAGGTGSASVCLPKRGLRPNSIDTIKPARAFSSRSSRSEYTAGEVVF